MYQNEDQRAEFPNTLYKRIPSPSGDSGLCNAGNTALQGSADKHGLGRSHRCGGLYCTPDHPCVGIKDPHALKAALAKAEISAHSFVFNPIDQDLDPKLLDQSKGVAQDTIELSTYLALSGSHVSLIPINYAKQWVEAGQLVQLAPSDYAIVSQFHALRLLSAKPQDVADLAWRQFKAS